MNFSDSSVYIILSVEICGIEDTGYPTEACTLGYNMATTIKAGQIYFKNSGICHQSSCIYIYFIT